LFVRIFAPLFALLISSLAISAALYSTKGLDVNNFIQGDAGHYLAIAQDGYNLFSCSSLEGYPPDGWCGNAGWLPGYPLLLRFFQSLSYNNIIYIGLILSLILTLLNLNIIFHLLKIGKVDDRKIFLLLTIAACFPGAVYHLSLFPMSFVVLGALATLIFFEKKSYLISGLFGGVVAFSYSTGFLLAPTLCLGGIRKSDFKQSLISPLFVGGGLVATWIYFYLVVKHWNAMFMVQAKYGHGIHNPLTTLYQQIEPVINLNDQSFVIAAQSLFVALALLVVFLYKVFHRKKFSSLDNMILIYSLIMWLFPLIMGKGVSLYRAESLLLPLVILFRHLPNPFIYIFTVVAVFLHFFMSRLYFTSILV
jgi:hypothetical protein